MGLEADAVAGASWPGIEVGADHHRDDGIAPGGRVVGEEDDRMPGAAPAQRRHDAPRWAASARARQRRPERAHADAVEVRAHLPPVHAAGFPGTSAVNQSSRGSRTTRRSVIDPSGRPMVGRPPSPGGTRVRAAAPTRRRSPTAGRPSSPVGSVRAAQVRSVTIPPRTAVAAQPVERPADHMSSAPADSAIGPAGPPPAVHPNGTGAPARATTTGLVGAQAQPPRRTPDRRRRRVAHEAVGHGEGAAVHGAAPGGRRWRRDRAGRGPGSWPAGRRRPREGHDLPWIQVASASRTLQRQKTQTQGEVKTSRPGVSRAGD